LLRAPAPARGSRPALPRRRRERRAADRRGGGGCRVAADPGIEGPPSVDRDGPHGTRSSSPDAPVHRERACPRTAAARAARTAPGDRRKPRGLFRWPDRARAWRTPRSGRRASRRTHGNLPPAPARPLPRASPAACRRAPRPPVRPLAPSRGSRSPPPPDRSRTPRNATSAKGPRHRRVGHARRSGGWRGRALRPSCLRQRPARSGILHSRCSPVKRLASARRGVVGTNRGNSTVAAVAPSPP